MTHIIWTRQRHLVNTDPQRRCYNGAHFSSELVWGPWEELDYTTKPEERLKFWTELNDVAVSARGEGAQREYEARIIEEQEVKNDANVPPLS